MRFLNSLRRNERLSGTVTDCLGVSLICPEGLRTSQNVWESLACAPPVCETVWHHRRQSGNLLYVF
ncbi:hypothetical protein DPMN_015976 [Dreissena polymorpha]|uniref:Uncharacterized protein n=1 Tax=Dreissena polymorpha TaxID=45954 RepID=A0A9D4NCJ4_DREPO|nr:hypothetical protein DPMN_015976 [Dreissena polymorpha]